MRGQEDIERVAYGADESEQGNDASQEDPKVHDRLALLHLLQRLICIRGIECPRDERSAEGCPRHEFREEERASGAVKG